MVFSGNNIVLFLLLKLISTQNLTSEYLNIELVEISNSSIKFPQEVHAEIMNNKFENLTEATNLTVIITTSLENDNSGFVSTPNGDNKNETNTPEAQTITTLNSTLTQNETLDLDYDLDDIFSNVADALSPNENRTCTFENLISNASINSTDLSLNSTNCTEVKLCNVSSVLRDVIACKGYGECVVTSWLLDNKVDCLDGSDEDPNYACLYLETQFCKAYTIDPSLGATTVSAGTNNAGNNGGGGTDGNNNGGNNNGGSGTNGNTNGGNNNGGSGSGTNGNNNGGNNNGGSGTNGNNNGGNNNGGSGSGTNGNNNGGNNNGGSGSGTNGNNNGSNNNGGSGTNGNNNGGNNNGNSGGGAGNSGTGNNGESGNTGGNTGENTGGNGGNSGTGGTGNNGGPSNNGGNTEGNGENTGTNSNGNSGTGNNGNTGTNGGENSGNGSGSNGNSGTGNGTNAGTNNNGGNTGTGGNSESNNENSGTNGNNGNTGAENSGVNSANGGGSGSGTETDGTNGNANNAEGASTNNSSVNENNEGARTGDTGTQGSSGNSSSSSVDGSSGSSSNSSVPNGGANGGNSTANGGDSTENTGGNGNNNGNSGTGTAGNTGNSGTGGGNNNNQNAGNSGTENGNNNGDLTDQEFDKCFNDSVHVADSQYPGNSSLCPCPLGQQLNSNLICEATAGANNEVSVKLRAMNLCGRRLEFGEKLSQPFSAEFVAYSKLLAWKLSSVFGERGLDTSGLCVPVVPMTSGSVISFFTLPCNSTKTECRNLFSNALKNSSDDTFDKNFMIFANDCEMSGSEAACSKEGSCVQKSDGFFECQCKSGFNGDGVLCSSNPPSISVTQALQAATITSSAQNPTTIPPVGRAGSSSLPFDWWWILLILLGILLLMLLLCCCACWFYKRHHDSHDDQVQPLNIPIDPGWDSPQGSDSDTKRDTPTMWEEFRETNTNLNDTNEMVHYDLASREPSNRPSSNASEMRVSVGTPGNHVNIQGHPPESPVPDYDEHILDDDRISKPQSSYSHQSSVSQDSSHPNSLPGEEYSTTSATPTDSKPIPRVPPKAKPLRGPRYKEDLWWQNKEQFESEEF